MRCSRVRAALAGCVAAIILAPASTRTAVQTGQHEAQTVTVPPGFAVEQVAGPPLVDRPIVADFDDEGRLYVADSSGSNDKVDKQLSERPHRIVRLEDTDGDGRFDRSVVFADRMMFPEGTMWFDGSLYVAAPPSIWKLTDTDGDGVADEREEWFQGKTLTGCANDLHGPYLGPDGWIYWTKGAFAQQTYEREGRAPFVTRASHIFRRRPGTLAIEPVMTGGMDNPVDVAFTSTGERILTATFLEHPQLGKRDAIIHAVYGGVYGKLHSVLDGHTRTGDLLPVMAQLGPAVPSGLTRYTSGIFGETYRDNFFATMFNLRKVTRHVLQPRGATFELDSSDFLVSSSRDFHPTDVLEDADGSLLVIDTGPWYKLCCPTSQLAKPDVLGGIYRIRRVGASSAADPRGQRLRWATMGPEDLVRLLDDTRPAVQARAIHLLGRSGERATAVLRRAIAQAGPAEVRRNAVWALTRSDHSRAREAVRDALRDADDRVRQAAIYSAGLWRDADAVPQLLDALTSASPAVQRVAAEALGRAGDRRAISHLLAAAARTDDRVLEHALTYALIEIGDPSQTLTHAGQGAASRARRAAFIAVDQMEGGGLDAAAVMPFLDSEDATLQQTAWWIAGHHPEWGSSLAAYFAPRLARSSATAPDATTLAERIAVFAAHESIQDLLASTVARPSSPGARIVALRAMAAAKGRFKVLPQAWAMPLTDALASGDDATIRLAVAVVRGTPAKDGAAALQAALLRVGRDTSRATDVRVDALSAIHDGATALDGDVFELLIGSLDPGQPAFVRAAAAGVIERSRLDRSQLLLLAAALTDAAPLELPRLLRPFENGTDETVGQALMAALEQSKIQSAIRPDQLRAGLKSYPLPVQRRAEALLARSSTDATNQMHRLEQLLATLGDGDVRRGQAVFNSEKTACLACHAIGYIGGRIGPDLTRIGQVRSERDLLEAIVFPSASFARSYEPYSVKSISGAVHSGVLRSESADEIVLGLATGEEIRIPRREIAEMQPGTVSLMPSGLHEQLTSQELADLLAFLKATRSGAN